MPIWISHRGIRAVHDENTMESFDAAVAVGFRVLETDLRPTSDGHLVLCHDPSLRRVALGFEGEKDTFISKLSRAELEAVRLKKGGRFLFFDQFMERYAGLNWVFDIKPDQGLETTRRLQAWAARNKAEKWLAEAAYFLFWDQRQENSMRAYLPRGRFFAKERECWRAGLSAFLRLPILGGLKENGVYAIPPKLGGMDLFKPEFVRMFHRYKTKTIAYLPTTREEANLAIKAGFDYILTDHERVEPF